MNRNILTKEFMKAVGEMRRTHGNGTYYWTLGEDDNGNTWAIVLGWADGFDEEPNDDCTDGTWRLCAKLAYQPNNSLMQCDYDVDWDMPYDEETMEVYDNEISIYPNTDLQGVVNWLFECYDSYLNDEDEDESELLDKFMKNRACRTITDLIDYITYLEDVRSDHKELKEKIANLNMLASEMY
jgi:hypothetical protein